MTRALEEVLRKTDVPWRAGVMSAALSTFRIGGPAAVLIEPRCMGELVTAVKLCKETHCPFAVIGRGSNILFDDAPLPMALIRTVRLNAVRFTSYGVKADCGLSLGGLCTLAASRGFADLCFAYGIPGTLGGGVFMNAGAHGRELSECVRSVTVYSPETDKIETLFNDQLNFSYRKSIFQENSTVILSATLFLRERADPTAVFAQMRDLRAARSRTQPVELPSAGSVFRRPAPDLPIGRLLDELGLKHLRVGGAAVSGKHAGFIVNLGGATAADVKQLIVQIQNIVEKERGIRPQTELRFIPLEHELFDRLEGRTD